MDGAKKIFFIIAGWLSVILGVVGAFVPILPTTPFLILAAFLFSRSSPKLHNWLLSQKHLGPPIKDWQQHKVIRPRAKIFASIAIILVFSLSIGLGKMHLYLKLMQIVIGISVLTFVLSRKSHPIGP